ncbi:MAG: nitrate reductase cytochrome c-type subunit [Gammaproteobacteria bacterium]|uniref:Periplasmic nitrate reductase, electron transfer subunit n=1 Tax=Candidatus Thiopontia autotrophica TaxID=2841688 RepID=A0A8J6TVS9_9GAMM|nr:nitrate reductase cytochrome c-type subunit [Candidatus Thiopontia autotrophica]MBL6969496.1 nitrate reductase cytochrome c-type subunit [Gammaproteobacteria bacterium]
MKKSIKLIAGVALSCFVVGVAGADVSSLRGGNALDAGAEKTKRAKIEKVSGGIARTWAEQPPMIPHDVDKYRISIKNNGCLKCHGAATYVKEKSPKVGDSHFLTREDKALEKVSSRRWFCSQCHATQKKLTPLVANTFETVDRSD